MAAIDCCTREIVGWHIELRCRAMESIVLVERAVAERGVPPGGLTLGTDNGSAFTARAFKALLGRLGIAHRRGGYRDPESHAFIESWFGKLKQRCVWLHEFETLEQAREALGAYIDRYHSSLDYRTPEEETDLGGCPGGATKSGRLRCQCRRGAGHSVRGPNRMGFMDKMREAAEAGEQKASARKEEGVAPRR